MAARLCSLAGPGEVLASEAVVHLARTVPGVRYLQGRMERLKGIHNPCASSRSCRRRAPSPFSTR